MNDRELLELAAKAAGMDYLVWTPGCAPIVPFEHRVREDVIADKICWNPIHYDGDALRLAVKLRLDVAFFEGGEHVSADRYVTPANIVGADEDYGDDVNAATRRAIVRAAAEIGKDMK